MLYLIPPPVHRLALRMAFRLRARFRRIARPRLAGVSVIVTDEDGRILLARHSYGPQGWALPSGGLGPGEDPELGVRREIREELGCELGRLEILARIEETISGAPHTAHVFGGVLQGDPVPDNREIVSLRWFARHELHGASLTRLTRARLLSLGYYSSDS